MADQAQAVVLSKLDIAEYLESAEDIAGYLEALLEEGDEKAFVAGLGHVARARGMSAKAVRAIVARDAGLGRASLYKALREGGNPEFSTVLKVAKALGVKLIAVPA